MQRSFTVALSFLTRLPVRVGEVSPAELARAVAYFPVVGLALGVALAAVLTLMGDATSSFAMAVTLVALLAGITGALHLDGVADVADAMGGGRGNRERMLEIMKDSRIGAHGAVALVLVLVAKVALFEEALGREAPWAAIVLTPMVARWACAGVVATAPYARTRGTGSPFAAAKPEDVLPFATVVTAVAVVLLSGATGVLAMVFAGLVAWAFSTWFTRQLGGLTGDGYGTTLELAELAFLLAL